MSATLTSMKSEIMLPLNNLYLIYPMYLHGMAKEESAGSGLYTSSEK